MAVIDYSVVAKKTCNCVSTCSSRFIKGTVSRSIRSFEEAISRSSCAFKDAVSRCNRMVIVYISEKLKYLQRQFFHFQLLHFQSDTFLDQRSLFWLRAGRPR